MKTSPLSLLAVSLLALTARHATALDQTWDGFDANWNDELNWLPGPVPVAADTAIFSAIGFNAPAATSSPLLNLRFDSTAQAYTISGGISIADGGTIVMENGSAAQTITASAVFPGTATITNNSAANLLTLTGLYTGIAGKVLTFDGPGNITQSGNLGSAAGSFVKSGNGTLTFTASNASVSGGFTINAGTAIAGNINSFSNKLVTINGGTLQMNGNGAANYTGCVVNGNATLAVSGTSAWNFGQSALLNLISTSGTPVLTIRNLGTTASVFMNLTTSGFDGTIKIGDAIGGGIYMVNSVNAVGSPNTRLNIGEAGVAGTHVFGTRAILSDGTTMLPVPVIIGELRGANVNGKLAGRSNVGTRTTGSRYLVGGLNTSTTYDGTIVDGVTSGGSRQMNGNPDGTPSIAPDATSTYGRNNGIAGSQGVLELVKTGSGTLSLSSLLNTYTGGTVLQGGTLAIAGDGSLGAAYDGSLRPFSLIPGTGVYNSTDLPDATLSGGGGTGASIGLYSSLFSNNAVANYFLSFSSQPNDVNAVTITNTATGTGYISEPAVSFTGGTFGTAGTAPVGTVRVKGLLTFDGGTLRTDAATTSNRATVLTSNNGTINTNGFSSTFSGIFNGPGGLAKTGAGTLTLSGHSIYTGTTTITNGTLCVTGGIPASAVTINAGGTLGGTGATGPVTNAGTIAAGCSVGALATGALEMQTASSLGLEIGDWATGAGTGYDVINAASLDITATSAQPVTIKVSELALANYDGVTKNFTLIATTGGITGFAADKFTFDTAGFTSGAGPWSIGVSGNNLIATYTGTPAPYDTWIAGYYAGADALKTADPDKDGITNLAEFAFNSSPAAGNNPGGPNDGGIKAVTGGDALTLTIRVRSGAVFTGATALTAYKDGVTYTIAGSTGLTAWTADIDEVSPALATGLPAPDAGWEYRTFRFNSTTATLNRAQIRATASE